MADPNAKPCPICGKPSTERYRPFCSARCANVDLGRWFSGHYRLPGEPASPQTGAEDDTPD